MIVSSKYLHYDFNAGPNNVIQVTFNMSWVNVLLMDELNFNNYTLGRAYTYYGGKADTSPYNLRPPQNGHWNLVVDRGGENISTGVSVKVI